MSRENVEIVRRLYDEFFSKPERMFDPAVLAFFDPEIEIRQSTFLVGTQGTFHGYDGAARATREQMEVFRGLYFVPVDLADSDDETIAHVWRLRAGLVIAWHVYWDPSEAFEAVGLRE